MHILPLEVFEAKWTNCKVILNSMFLFKLLGVNTLRLENPTGLTHLGSKAYLKSTYLSQNMLITFIS